MDAEESLGLKELTEGLRQSYIDMVDEFYAVGEGYPYNNVPLAPSDFAAFVRELEDEKAGIGLPPGIVPQTTYLLVRHRERVLGEFRFRPTVPPPYLSNSGHVGYNVRPSERCKGYATKGLALIVERARALGLEGLMLPVEGENPGSVRVIEKNGGVLVRRDADPDTGEVTSLYWIAV
ncbi:MAG: GNAT family N-acetyltransferase [Chloroflexota bacterium]|nr:GNAT family N-acetyltransferase [Chloroflexota bacterium]